MKKEKLNQKWICTDPDNNQYRLDENQNIWTDRTFTFKQDDEEMTICLNDYTTEEILNMIGAFGYNGNGQDFWINGDTVKISNDIIAECVFEYEIGVV